MITLNKDVIQNSVRETKVDRLLKRNSDAHITRMMQSDDSHSQSMYPTTVAESYSDDEEKPALNNKNDQEQKQIEVPGTFLKEEITILPPRSNRPKESNLTKKLRENGPPPGSAPVRQDTSDRPSPSNTLRLKVFFADIQGVCKVSVDPSITVREMVTQAIQVAKSDGLKLRGLTNGDYKVHAMEDDEVDDDIKFGPEIVVGNMGTRELGLVYAPQKRPSSKAGRSPTLQMNPAEGRIAFVRIAIPGPDPESHVVRITDSISTLRDLFHALNHRKSSVVFHANFFDFYYEKNIHEPLDVSTPVSILQEDSLVVLPRTQFNSPEERLEAMQFEHVRLANEYVEFSVSKIGRTRKQRILGVDRWRIVKKALGEGLIPRDHLPIEIPHIISVKVEDNNNRQFTLKYNHPGGGTRTHTYEAATEPNCNEFVQKVKYLVELRKLQP